MDLASWPNAMSYAPLCGYALAVPVILPAIFSYTFNLNIYPLLTTILSVSILVYLTGAIHLDGLADICDGFGCHAEKDKRLKIMHDPNVGSFGVVGITILLLTKTSSLFVLYKNNIIFNAGAIIVIARTIMLLTAYISKPAENKGLGVLIIGKISNRSIYIGILFSIPCFLFLGTCYAAIFMILTAYIIKRKSKKLIGGLNGDGLGAICEITETVGLFVLAIYNSIIY